MVMRAAYLPVPVGGTGRAGDATSPRGTGYPVVTGYLFAKDGQLSLCHEVFALLRWPLNHDGSPTASGNPASEAVSPVGRLIFLPLVHIINGLSSGWHESALNGPGNWFASAETRDTRSYSVEETHRMRLLTLLPRKRGDGRRVRLDRARRTAVDRFRPLRAERLEDRLVLSSVLLGE